MVVDFKPERNCSSGHTLLHNFCMRKKSTGIDVQLPPVLDFDIIYAGKGLVMYEPKGIELACGGLCYCSLCGANKMKQAPPPP